MLEPERERAETIASRRPKWKDTMPTALICDDDDVLRRVVRTVLEDAGWEMLDDTERAIDAVDIVGMLKPDVLVLDVALPGINGLEAIDAVRNANPSTAIVLLSAFDLSDEELQSSGADAALAKSEIGALPTVLFGLTAARS